MFTESEYLMIYVLHLYVRAGVASAAGWRATDTVGQERNNEELTSPSADAAQSSQSPRPPPDRRKSSCLAFTDWNQMQFVLIVHNRTTNCFRATALRRRRDRPALPGHQQADCRTATNGCIPTTYARRPRRGQQPSQSLKTAEVREWSGNAVRKTEWSNGTSLRRT